MYTLTICPLPSPLTTHHTLKWTTVQYSDICTLTIFPLPSPFPPTPNSSLPTQQDNIQKKVVTRDSLLDLRFIVAISWDYPFKMHCRNVASAQLWVQVNIYLNFKCLFQQPVYDMWECRCHYSVQHIGFLKSSYTKSMFDKSVLEMSINIRN